MADQNELPRRHFLAALAGGTAALAAGALAAEKLEAQRASPEYPPPQGGWDLEWVSRIERARYRMVFDSPEVGDGLALTNALVYLRGFREVYNARDDEFGVVIVVRHHAMPIVLGDGIWTRLKLGDSTKVADPTSGESARRNAFVKLKSDDRHASVLPEGALDTLLQRGVIVLACNLALMRMAGQLAQAEGIPLDDARAQMIDALVPGVVRQPSGIFAVARAQEAGCRFVRST